MNVALEQRRVLVLNRNWSAIAVASLARAFKLLFSNCVHNGEVVPRAKIVTSDFQAWTWEDWARLQPKEGEDSLMGVRRAFKVPTVILLTKYDKLPQQRVHFSRRAIYRRDNYTCGYCGCRPGTSELSLDHIIPKSVGGKTDWTNIILCCTTCNRRKANRSLKEAGMKMLWEPKKPKFNLFKSDRVVISEDWKNFISEAYWSVELED